ncbi:MAG: hypothetical protein DRN24_06965 [Thermoplasmata archaeon]|nr:MAG: hypothetical protein DRN24_06965 [Thermoplasmata archaeon]
MTEIKDTGVDDLKYQDRQQTSKVSKTVVASVLLILAGVINVIFWIPLFFIDTTTLNTMINITQFKQINPDITIEQIHGFFTICATIGVIIALFPILGGILSLKRKMWGLCLACSIIGVFTFIPSIIAGVLSLISMVLLIISKKEFQ